MAFCHGNSIPGVAECLDHFRILRQVFVLAVFHIPLVHEGRIEETGLSPLIDLSRLLTIHSLADCGKYAHRVYALMHVQGDRIHLEACAFGLACPVEIRRLQLNCNDKTLPLRSRPSSPRNFLKGVVFALAA